MVDRNSATHDNEVPAAQGDHQPASRKMTYQNALSQIELALGGLKYGQVTISVQDGVVVQIDRLERTRVQRNS